MLNPRVVFFDVGNTLLFPNRPKMLASIPADSQPTLEQWQSLERKTKIEFDRDMQTGKIDHSFWRIFHGYLIQMLDAVNNSDGLLDELVHKTQQSANWDQILPGTREALDRLATQFRIAVISNADGKIGEVLSRCAIADCFESITDSGIVGVEKPRPEIFHAALKAMNARAGDSLYVGDVYSVDYVGARNSGMEAVLFDVAGAYRDRPEPRVESLAELENRLRN
jgi:HAD superfamily hydrolase (TIGR01549 family)